jgi:hypothetical protein
MLNNKIKMKKLFLVIILFTITYVEAQNPDKITAKYNFRIEPRIQYGFIMPHYQSFRYFIKKHTKSFELNFGIKTSGSKIWQSIYHYPTLGLGFYFADLGNNEILGNSAAAYGYFNTHLFASKHFNLNFNFAFGISYIKKVFNSETNYYNLALGSHFNAYANLSLETKIKLSKKINLVSGIGLTHYSNGAIKMPNRGLNVISCRVGFDYLFNNPEIKSINNFESVKYNRYFDLFLNYSLGIKRNYPVSNPKPFIISIITADYGLNLNHKSRIGIGFDILNNPSKKESLEKIGFTEIKFPDYISGGIHLSYDIKIGDVSFLIHQGFTIYNKLKNSAILYHRFGFKYKITKNIFLNFTLNTYFVRAEWIEWGGGFYF